MLRKLVLLSWLPLNLVTALPNQQQPGITLDTGIWQGVTVDKDEKQVVKYLGIPFATAPRFAPPTAPVASKSQRKADKISPSCIQNSSGSLGAISSGAESEDCLALNIYAPATTASSSQDGKTVLVWFYGGALQGGSNAQAGYDGSSLAANQNVILVAPNYRVNVFGFPGAIPGVSSKEQNLGFLDQRIALDWIQANIAKFGGDPKKVTIFGESAGARSVDFHLLTNNPQNPPFRAVIVQSGSASITPGRKNAKTPVLPQNPPSFVELAKKAGCPDSWGTQLRCMREIPVDQIKKALSASGMSFGAVDDDGFTTVKDAEKWRREGRAANVSLLIGTNAEEAKLGIAPRGITLDQYLDQQFPPALKHHILMAYKPDPKGFYKTDFDAIAGIETDIGFTCVTSKEAKVSAEAGYPTWRYFFNASYPNTEIFPGSGAYHSSEIQFIFGNLKAQPPSTPEQISLSKVMQKTWADFAKNPSAGPGWHKVGTKGGKDLGHFNYNGKVIIESSEFVDRWCHHWATGNYFKRAERKI